MKEHLQIWDQERNKQNTPSEMIAKPEQKHVTKLGLNAKTLLTLAF